MGVQYIMTIHFCHTTYIHTLVLKIW